MSIYMSPVNNVLSFFLNLLVFLRDMTFLSGWGNMATVRDFIFGAPKSLQMVTAAMKLKGACSLDEKL